MDQNDQIEYAEFLTLYRHVQNPDVQLNKVKELFYSEADVESFSISGSAFYLEYKFIYLIGEKAMSFNRFVAVAVKFQLFSIEKQREFAEKTEVNLINLFIQYGY